jgi:hypothetical protein
MFERKYDVVRSGTNKGRIMKRSNSRLIPEDEPLFIFRAQDRKAICALVAYNMVLDNLEQKESVTKSINDFRRFQEEHPKRMKEPDL